MTVQRNLLMMCLITAASVGGVMALSSGSAMSLPSAAPLQQVSATPRPLQGEPNPFDQIVTTTPTPQPRIAQVSALGSIEVDANVAVSSQTSGRVAEVLVETGDVVAAGDVLVRLDDENERVTYSQARLSLERAQTNLTELMQPVDENDVRVAEANLASAQAAYSTVANATSDEDIAAAELDYQQALEQYQALEAARHIMSGTDEEIAMQDADIGEASFNAEIARLRLEDLRAGNPSDLWEAGALIQQRRLELEQVQAGPTEAEITSAEIAIQRAEQQLTNAETALNRTQIVAPAAGVVFSISVDEGDSVSPGMAVVEIVDTAPLWMVAQVDEVDISQLTIGSAATVRLDALQELDIQAVVEEIALIGTEIDGVVYFDTRLRLDTTDPRVRVGMTAEAFFGAGA